MICCLQGRMGNQMFQYAMAKALALRLGCAVELNINRVTNVPLSRYNLCLWKGVNNSITAEEPNPITEGDLPYNEKLLRSIRCTNSIIGYWQTEKYFKEIKDQLKEDFTPRDPLTETGEATMKLIQAAGDRSVFLTIRRTDYVNSNFHGLLTMDYYIKALNYIGSRIKDPVIFVFSDEPEWCKANLKFDYETIVAGNYNMSSPTVMGREDEELWLMRHCKHAIMANSSYSWWGAWLNDTGIVIGPKKWLVSQRKDYSDIMPDRWVKI